MSNFRCRLKKDKIMEIQLNVLGKELMPCSTNPRTGFYRTGCCETGPDDFGSHTICVQLTERFLIFSKQAGNDLSTPMPQFGFKGLKPGDRWCLCASRWQEAFEAGNAPLVYLEGTNQKALEIVDLEDLINNSVEVVSGGEVQLSKLEKSKTD